MSPPHELFICKINLGIERKSMCMRITCSTCKKQTWTGCGNHIESALRGIPEELRCKCRKK